MPLLLKRIRRLRSAASDSWSSFGPPLAWQSAVAQVLLGCLISGGLLWTLGAILEMAGAFAAKGHAHASGSLVSKVLIPAAAASLMEEWLFRGVLLGLWLRFARTVPACIGTSALFAFLHFLKPPDGSLPDDPAHAMAGFDLLGKILLQFADPLVIVTDFTMLLGVGLILAWTRVRTGALWFAIGLHAGWIMAFKGFNTYHQPVPAHFLRPWGVGDNLRVGILPLVTLGLTAVVCHFAMRLIKPSNPA